MLSAVLAVVVSLMIAAPAHAALDRAVDLADGFDVRVTGVAAGDVAGGTVSAIGDVNADGKGDFAVTARLADPLGRANAGSVYVVFGAADHSTVDLGALGTRGFRIDGAAAGDEAGGNAAGAGDVNGDGIDDLALVAHKADGNGVDSGSAFVVFGSASPSDLDLAALGTRGFRIDGAGAGNQLFALAGVEQSAERAQIADTNGDGRADVVLGSRFATANGRATAGSAYVVFGKASSTRVDLANLGTGGFAIWGASAGDEAGIAVGRADDCSGDGLPEILVGAHLADNNLRTSSGSLYVVTGRAATTAVDLAASAGLGYEMRYDGATAGEQLGYSVGSLDDVDSDGCSDFAVGAPGATSRTGRAYSILARPAGVLRTVDLAGTFPGYRIDGIAAGDEAGHAMRRAGDVDGDGIYDLLVGSPYSEVRPIGAGTRTDAGAAFVVYGKSTSETIALGSLGSSGFPLGGAASADKTSGSLGVTGVGDQDGDGYPELLVGALEFDGAAGSNSGAAYLVRTHAAPVNHSPPAIAGTARDGQVLSARPGGWRGVPPPAYSYEWRRCDAGGEACNAIAGATSATYTLRSADVGSTLRVRVTGTSALGSASAESAPTPVVAPAAPANASAPTVSGTTREAETLYSTTGSWSGTTPFSYAYRWERCPSTGGACSVAQDGPDSQYDLVLADVGNRMQVTVTATNVAGSASATSQKTATIDPAAPAELAPDTQITSGPASPTASTSASFAFTSPQANVSYECRLDRSVWASCSSPKAYSGVAEGPHTFEVRARDLTGNPDRSPAAHEWTIDVSPPQTTIDAGPSGSVSSPAASFAFSSSESGSTFECRLDGGAWDSCSSPRSYESLPDGAHSFEVRARDGVGNLDATPAAREWTVDTVEPDTTIDSAPPPYANSASASFGFSASENDVTFDCRLDDAAWGACESPHAYDGLTDGAHAVEVRARDAAGNVDASPVRHDWTVDTSAPDTTISGGPADPTANDTASFTLASSESDSAFECRLDAGDWAPCSSPRDYTGLSHGRHTFEARASDRVGWTDETPASYSWTVDLEPPDTSIPSGPSDPTSQQTASFELASPDPAATFECRLDEGAWSACASPHSVSDLAHGAHVFEARAVDPVGHRDGTPASHAWTVDLNPPETTIDSAPPSVADSGDASFSFSADETGATFECKLDTGPWSACTSPASYSNLAVGPHRFEVRATDRHGHLDQTPANHVWDRGPRCGTGASAHPATADTRPSFATHHGAPPHWRSVAVAATPCEEQPGSA